MQTCDAFVQVMDEIMELSEATHVFAVASNRIGDSYNDMQGGGSKRAARRSRDTCDSDTLFHNLGKFKVLRLTPRLAIPQYVCDSLMP